METKVILFSQVPLPFSKIGSWTTLYDNYLRQNNAIDIIICPVPVEKYSNISYAHLSMHTSLSDKVLQKFNFKQRWHQAVSALENVLQSDTKYIIHIIDNYGLAMAVAHYLEKNKIRSNFYIHYFYHGFPSFKNEMLYSKVDELTLLTYKSYNQIKRNVSTFPCRISVLHNGIDTTLFYPLSPEMKQKLRRKFDVGNKTVFLWCSQDRPKKGLHIILDAWKRIIKQHTNIELWIIGTDIKANTENIKYIGRIPNKDLGSYYQVSDVFLFSTLCQEGFPLSLTEAKHAGCYCIASALGGVTEVLDEGKYGRLIENPNFIDEWIIAIEDYLKGNYENVPLPKELYTKEAWNENMNTLIETAKERIKN